MKLSRRRKKLSLGLKKIMLKPDSNDSKDSSAIADKPQETGNGKFNEVKLYKVTPNLFMSGYHSAKDFYNLRHHNINHIVNLTSHKCKNIFLDNFDYSSFELSDNSSFDLKPQLDIIVNIINQQIKQGKRVLVHCRMGVSRAPSIVLAYLIKVMNIEYDKAFEFLLKINSKISPNFGFLMQLQSL